ncbi:hypothetical protein HEP_00535000, partial [Hepatocystis sp. ex Piliocolobus tephrosceles]
HSLFIDKDAYRTDHEVIIIKSIIHQLYKNVFKNKKNYTNLMKKMFPEEYYNKNINKEIFSLYEEKLYNEKNHVIKLDTNYCIKKTWSGEQPSELLIGQKDRHAIETISKTISDRTFETTYETTSETASETTTTSISDL